MKNNNKGFSLVELIVVIAIMAILAAVAVVGFSLYIPKAQQASDKQMVGDIEYILTLAGYDGSLVEGDSGYIVLSVDGIVNDDIQPGSFLDATLKASYGENYSDSLKLAYDSWGVKSQIISSADATAILNSNFTQKYTSNQLMAEVQAITNAVNGLSLELGDTTITLYDMFGYEDEEGQSQNVIEDVIAEYGISKSWAEMTSTEKSNLMVLATASSINNDKASGAATVIPTYALYTAYAAENSDFNAAYKTFQEAIKNVNPDSADSQVDQIKDAYDALETAAQDTGFNTWKQTNGDATQNAFEAIMAGVGNAMDDNGDAILNDLNKADMFTAGVGNEMYNDYLDSVYAAAGVVGSDESGAFGGSDMVAEGYITIWYTVRNGKIYIDNSMPITE